ncbi:hypothetical protein QYS46_27385 [Klebsiella michiganensis]|nr:hypothetical protein [Klebsiella michiganensis]
MLKPVELIEDDESLVEAMAAVASAMADASRLKILCALMDGTGVDGDRAFCRRRYFPFDRQRAS